VIAIPLALAASLLYGLSDFLGGVKSRTLPQLSVLLISQATTLGVLVMAVVVLAPAPPSGSYLVYAVAGGLLEAVGVAAMYRGLAVGSMSVVAPVAATAPVVPVVAGLALGELPTPVQGGGILLAVAGVTMISLVSPDRGGARDVGPSVVFGLLTALGFGGYFAVMDTAVEGGVTWALLVARLTTVVVFASVFLAIRPTVGVKRADVPVLMLIGALILGADAMYALASTRGLLSVVAVLSSLYPVVTVTLAHRYLNERIERPQLRGIAVAFAGAAALSIA